MTLNFIKFDKNVYFLPSFFTLLCCASGSGEYHNQTLHVEFLQTQSQRNTLANMTFSDGCDVNLNYLAPIIPAGPGPHFRPIFF